MIPSEFIRVKRDGGAHTSERIHSFIQGIVARTIPDYQIAAWLMAVFLRGLNHDELAALTDAMIRSGESLDLDDVPGVKADKHSTGGVGDKVTLALAPLAAACGLVAPMLAGRGLGHTGGTIDKLEAIPGMRCDLDAAKFKSLLRRIGVALGTQTGAFAPADRRLYALRDVTATVESIPLIASSIMSKKLAIRSDLLALDVKTGDGAFMSNFEDARELAATMVEIGRNMGRRVSAMITDMSQPLGRAVGNANEVAEAVELLKGRGPDDLRRVTLALTARMLTLGGVARDTAHAYSMMEKELASGAALEKFREVIQAQGGDPRVVDDPARVLPRAPRVTRWVAPRAGHVAAIRARAIGLAAVELGAGRLRLDDRVDPSVGILLQVKIGDRVEAGQPMLEIHYRHEPELTVARQTLAEAITISEEPVKPPSLIVSEEV